MLCGVGRYRLIPAIAIALAYLPAHAGPGSDDDETSIPVPPPAKGQPLVTVTAPWQWQLVTAPRLTQQIGAIAIAGLDVAAGRRSEPPPLTGEPVDRAPRWPYALASGSATATAIPKPGDDDRIAAALGVTTFKLAAADQGLAMLELRAKYEDGLAVWLNGVEVVRESLPRGATTVLATLPHGPEWETFYIPVAPGLLRLGDNTLAVEVHPSARRDAPSFAVDLIGRRDRGIVRGPQIAEVAQTAATIAVDTDPDVDVTLAWGTRDALDHELASPPGRRHVFKLTGLPAGAQINYRVRAGASQTARLTFHTLPGPGETLRIGVYGDVRGGHATHRRLVEHMLNEALDLVAVTGDMVLHGSDEADWQRFFGITGELLSSVPYYPAVGNHDLGWDGAGGSRRADTMFALPPPPPGRPDGAHWYSRDVGDVHLVFLDSNAYERSAQETWLDADLAAARRRSVRAIVAFTHDGPYSRGEHGGNAVARDRYVPILLRHHVDYLFSGHDHIYQRGQQAGLRYAVSGGGGAGLYDIRCGVDGKRKCKVEDGMLAVAKEHHYIVLAIGKRELELCARRPDGTLLEKCAKAPLWVR
jgi:acid phosphatase type 7